MEICEINRYIRGYYKGVKNKQKDEITQAWYTAVFNNQKKIPPLEDVLKDFEKQNKTKNKNEHLEKIKRIKEGR